MANANTLRARFSRAPLDCTAGQLAQVLGVDLEPLGLDADDNAGVVYLGSNCWMADGFGFSLDAVDALSPKTDAQVAALETMTNEVQ